MLTFNQVTTNWKTTVVGILQFLIVLFTALIALWDGVDTTVPDWNTVFASAVILFGMLSARDADKSSQQNKIRPTYINTSKDPFSKN